MASHFAADTQQHRPRSRAHVTPYAISYTLWYISLTVLVALLFALLEWPGGMGTVLLIAFGASWGTGRRFARREGRAPTSLEGKAYSWRALLGCFLATTALSFLVAFLAFGPAQVQQVLQAVFTLDFIVVGLMLLLIFSALFYGVIRIGFAWAGAKYATQD